MSAPTVTSISPASGPLSGGISVTITGTNFTGATVVTIGGVAATSLIVVNDTSITCTTPMGSAGTASVLVTNASGTNAANSLYTYQAAPTVSSISPPIGSHLGSTSATLTGTNFTGATGITIGGTAATNVTVTSSTSITCTAPAGSLGGAGVVVTTPGGSNSSNSLFFYIAAVPADTYIYLKGGRGDGFVPLWTGEYTDALLDEKSEPYRNIFQSTAQTSVNGVNGVSSTGMITMPGLLQTARNFFPSGYSVDANLSYTAGAISDEAALAPPRQFDKQVTWRAYTSSNGLQYHFRLADILGVGSQPRSE